MIVYSIFLGFVQALTEFLPISSSGHLLLLHNILNFNLEQNLAFDCALHLGTGLALLIYFWGRIKKFLAAFWAKIFFAQKADKENLSTFYNLVIAVIPAGVIGLLLESFIETRLRGVWLVIVMLILVAVLFFVAERFCNKGKDLKDLNWRQALLIGFGQCLALIPGVSRSGISIVSGMALGLQRSAAAEFSFLVGLPVILGAGIYKLWQIDFGILSSNEIWSFVLGFLSSLILGIVFIKFLLRYLQTHSLRVFAWYRIALALLLIVYFYFGK